MVLKELFVTVSNLGGCSGLEELIFISVTKCLQLCYTSHNVVHVVVVVVLVVVGIIVNN